MRGILRLGDNAGDVVVEIKRGFPVQVAFRGVDD